MKTKKPNDTIKKNNQLKGKMITMLGFQTKTLNTVVRNSTQLRQVATKGRYYSQEVPIEPPREKTTTAALYAAMKLGSLALAAYGGFKLSSFLNTTESYPVGTCKKQKQKNHPQKNHSKNTSSKRTTDHQAGLAKAKKNTKQKPRPSTTSKPV